MRLAVLLVTACVLALTASGSAAPETQLAASTIEQCSALLPPGKHYDFFINGTIDYTGAKPILHGDLSVTDEMNNHLTQQAGPFVQCFAKLVR